MGEQQTQPPQQDDDGEDENHRDGGTHDSCVPSRLHLVSDEGRHFAYGKQHHRPHQKQQTHAAESGAFCAPTYEQRVVKVNLYLNMVVELRLHILLSPGVLVLEVSVHVVAKESHHWASTMLNTA